MLDSTTRLFRAAVAVFSVFLAAPVLAQAPSEPSTRASVLDQAREALATQSAPPRRSLIERGLYWYDNQSVLARGLGGWKGVRIAGGDFPAGAGMKVGLAFDKSLTTVDPDPDAPNRLALATRGAYSTRGYKRVSAAIDARNLAGSVVNRPRTTGGTTDALSVRRAQPSTSHSHALRAGVLAGGVRLRRDRAVGLQHRDTLHAANAGSRRSTVPKRHCSSPAAWPP